ncbi:hypothetical protein PVAND_007315 [Polypedilum vanderplanki]|uniref:Secreted protein n=1 Tax=Polypedilum vanderplanki TaxID=319348 RepID=A0A9J6C6K5_POLVA|nr:hypothetical protein PVAND_007315 [Polypedilum vanderplanki]
MFKLTIFVFLAICAVANCGVISSAYISPYASTYNAHTINHAIASQSLLHQLKSLLHHLTRCHIHLPTPILMLTTHIQPTSNSYMNFSSHYLIMKRFQYK